MWWSDEHEQDEGYVRHLSARELARRVAYLFRPHARSIAVAVALLFATIAAELAGPLVLRHLIDEDIRTGDRRGIVLSALVYAGIFVVGMSAAFAQVVVVTRVGLAIVTRLKEEVFAHLLTLSAAYFDKHPPGRLMARVESDAQRLQALFSEVGLALFRSAVLLFATLSIMLAADARVTGAVLLLASPVVLGSVLLLRRVRGLWRAVRKAVARVTQFLTEYVQAVPVIQAYGYATHARMKLAERNREKVSRELRAMFVEQSFFSALASVEILAVLVIIWIGSQRAFGEALTVGTLVLFVEYTRRLFMPILMFSEQISFMQRALASADRVFGVLDTPSLTPDRKDALDRVPADWREIAFEDVSFGYDGGRAPAVEGLRFRVGRGEKVAVVGVSGSGKSTLASLLLRFYEPTSGRIALDGRDIRDIRQRAWRGRIGLVLQDIHLFPGTVAENLRCFDDDVPAAALDRSLDVVQAGEIVRRLPGGLDAPLAEGGTNLSMGERQLLCFARAIVRDPDVLVLDEATSSVDPATERRIQEAFERIMAGRTAIVIAHRLATVAKADRILVMHQGRLVEEGTHRELYARGGIYRDLVDLQLRPTVGRALSAAGPGTGGDGGNGGLAVAAAGS